MLTTAGLVLHLISNVVEGIAKAKQIERMHSKTIDEGLKGVASKVLQIGKLHRSISSPSDGSLDGSVHAKDPHGSAISEGPPPTCSAANPTISL
jgi:hypothetical protein